MKERINMKGYDFRGHLDGCNTHVANLAPSFNNECNCGYAQFKQSLDMGFMLEMTGEEQTAALVRWREATLGSASNIRIQDGGVAGRAMPPRSAVATDITTGADLDREATRQALVDGKPVKLHVHHEEPHQRTTSPGLENDASPFNSIPERRKLYETAYNLGHAEGYKKGQRDLVDRIDGWFKGR